MRSSRTSICESSSHTLKAQYSRSVILIPPSFFDGLIIAGDDAHSVPDLRDAMCASADELADVSPDDAESAEIHLLDVVTNLFDQEFLLHHVCILLAMSVVLGCLAPA
jgi:hypothetical protein